MSWDVSIERHRMTHEVCSWCEGHEQDDGQDKWEVNITYNVARMLMRAGIHPKVLDGMSVTEALLIVKNGYAVMHDNPSYFDQFVPQNGWGTVETTLTAISELLNALEHGSHPDDKVRWV